jgi:hypothetical protein
MKFMRSAGYTNWAHKRNEETLTELKTVTVEGNQTPPLVEEEAPFKNTYKSGKNKNMGIGPDEGRYKERLCWRGPAAIYWTELEIKPVTDYIKHYQESYRRFLRTILR